MLPNRMSEKSFNSTDFHGGTHKFAKCAIEKLSNASCRTIPKHLIETANTLFEARMFPGKIFNRLFEICMEENIEVTFNAKDIANLFKGRTVDKALDCTHLIQHLRNRESKDPSLKWEYDTDSEGCLSLVFFVMKDALKVWNEIDKYVVLFDTKRGTNCYGLYLGCFVTVDGNGKTRVLAGSIVTRQDHDSFKWVFNEFLKVFGEAVVIYTDSDSALASSI